MSTIYFCNNGYFDIRSMMTFGISAKESDDAIGYFGTGFKYAVAIILKNGGKISVKTGNEVYEFTSKTEEIRGKSFDVVYMNGQQAGFTTRLGINWKPWMAFRELYSNCLDENGTCSESPENTDTVITVSCDAIYDAYVNKHQYFISGEPLVVSSNVEVYDSKRPFIFYRGIAVKSLDNDSLYTYNIKSKIDLTEDRTAAHEYQLSFALKRCLQNIKNKVIIKKIVTAKDNYMEHGLGFDKDFGYSDEYINTCRELLAAGIPIKDSARKYLKTLDEKSGEWPLVELSSVQLSMLDKAIIFLSGIGINVQKYPIHVVDGLGDNVMGRALDDTIYLSLIPFNLGTKQVASTLLEEWVHNYHRCADFDRNMQSWLFDKILSIGEEINGEPL